MVILNDQFRSNAAQENLFATNQCLCITPDKVFGPTCQTDVVYEEGAKEVAMSALTGINGRLMPSLYFRGSVLSASDPLPCVCFAATIFAYGQTSSGKTFTMRGVTESAVNDIYRHIENVSL